MHFDDPREHPFRDRFGERDIIETSPSVISRVQSAFEHALELARNIARARRQFSALLS